MFSRGAWLTVAGAFLLAGAIMIGKPGPIAVSLGVIAAMFVARNRASLYRASLLCLYVLSPIAIYLSPSLGRKPLWVADFLLLVIAAWVLVDSLMRRERSRLGLDAPTVAIGSLLALATVSGAVNGVSPIVGLCGFRNYFKLLPLFFVVRQSMNGDALLRRSMTFWLWVALANVPVSIGQYLWFGLHGDFDAVSGLFGPGQSGVMSTYQIVIGGGLLLAAKHGWIGRNSAYLLTLTVLIPTFLNETKIVFVLIPIMIVFVYHDVATKKPLEALGVALAASGLLVGLAAVYTMVVPRFQAADLTSSDWLRENLYEGRYYAEQHESLNRISAVEFALANIATGPVRGLLGVGPGNASASDIPGGMGEYYRAYLGREIDLVFLSRLLWEFGFLGVLLYSVLIFSVWRRAGRVRGESRSSFVRTASDTFRLLAIVLTFTTIYNMSFYQDQLGCMFWCLGGWLSCEERPG